MQNLESVAQKMSELCSIKCAMPVTNLHVAVSAHDDLQKLFAPENVRFEEMINLRLVPSS